MGAFFDQIPESLIEWINEQKLFFVATAPRSDEGHVNVSPKGHDTLRIVSQNSHPPLSSVFAAFKGPPRIMRLFGQGKVIERGTKEFNNLIQNEPKRVQELSGQRAIIWIDIHKVGTSCGYSVPFFDYKQERDTLLKFMQKREDSEKQGRFEDGIQAYWRKKNSESMDGLPGYQFGGNNEDGTKTKVFDVATRSQRQSVVSRAGFGGGVAVGVVATLIGFLLLRHYMAVEQRLKVLASSVTSFGLARDSLSLRDMTTPIEPRADLVIVFDHDHKPQLSESKDQPSSNSSSVDQEYNNLLGALRDAGLHATGRSGHKRTKQVLIFVKASDERLQAEVYREHMSDWLHGVTSDRPAPKSPQDFSPDQLSPADRVRLVHSILTTSRSGSAGSIKASTASGTVAGIQPFDFPHVTSIFPPHDIEFNKQWLKKWSSRSQLVIPHQELTDIRNHFGEKIGLYFAFLRTYFRACVVPATLGTIWYLLGLAFSPFYSIALVMWSIWFVENWRIKERKLAVEWNTFGVERVETERTQFKGIKTVIDPVTGVEHQHFPLSTRLLRQLASVPALFGFALALATLISIIYSIETIVGEVYDGPGKRYLTLVPTVLFVGVVPRVTGLWQTTASRLTDYENHAHETEHDKSLTLKVFALNFLVAYGSLLLTSFVYIPFGGILIPFILSTLPSHHAAKLSSKASKGQFDYSINSAKLHTQIVAYTLTQQITGALTEIGVPFVMSFVNNKMQQVKDKKMKGSGGNDMSNIDKDYQDEHEYLERVRHESTLPEYSTFADYAEMTTQFGYMFELRSDAYKITHQVKRPIPVRETSIGPWLEALSFLSWLSALTNAALVYLYRPLLSVPHPIAEQISKMTHVNVTIPQNMTSTLNAHVTRIDLASQGINLQTNLVSNTNNNVVASVKQTLFAALLVALASEHAYLVLRGTIRWLLNQFKWLDSKPEQQIRKNQLQMKRNYLEEFNLKKSPIELTKLLNKGQIEGGQEKDVRTSSAKMTDNTQHNTEFWTRPDKGLEVLKGIKSKTE
ncbi:hypothetical protein OIO90_003229 [Microbotryomycetes sp. JL221]|nr:hypothetical protein OIO90_003229 [Microbotryomycetes sp. JL221]